MRIKTLKIRGFRNLRKADLEFKKDTKVFAFTGPNGQGKTNILEAIFLLAISKSFRTNENEDLVGFEDDFASLKTEVENDYLTVEVEDTGYGMQPEDLDKIFTRFYRVKDKNTRTIHGTGLGLAIVKSIVDSMHGSISVRSTPGEGTTFTVQLPLPGE